MVVRCSRCMGFKKSCKIPAKNVKEAAADIKDVVLKASLKKRKN